MIQLYGYQGRSRAERVLWALAELDLAFEMIRLDYTRGDNNNSDFLRLNPSGKVPVLVHNGHIFTESMAIIQYINTLSSRSLIPSEPLAKFEYDHRLFFLLTEVEPYLWIADQESFLSEKYPWPQGTTLSCQAALARALPQLDRWLQDQDYLANNQFSAVDILAYHVLSWASFYQLPLSQQLYSYLSRLEMRPSFPVTMKTVGSPAKTG